MESESTFSARSRSRLKSVESAALDCDCPGWRCDFLLRRPRGGGVITGKRERVRWGDQGQIRRGCLAITDKDRSGMDWQVIMSRPVSGCGVDAGLTACQPYHRVTDMTAFAGGPRRSLWAWKWHWKWREKII